MANRPISLDKTKLSCVDQGDEKRLDGEQKNLQQQSGCGEAAYRALALGYN